jgi:hypothetical protein
MFESGEGGVSGRSGECMSAREDRDCSFPYQEADGRADDCRQGELSLRHRCESARSDDQVAPWRCTTCDAGKWKLEMRQQIRLRGGLQGSHYQWRSAGIQVDVGWAIISSLHMIVEQV